MTSMTLSVNNKVDTFLRDTQAVSAQTFDIIMAIRKLFLDADAELEEDIKYGGVIFNQSGTLIGGIFTYKNYLSIEFSEGATFDDPDKLLEGKGKFRRHLKINSLDDIIGKKVAHFIGATVATYG